MIVFIKTSIINLIDTKGQTDVCTHIEPGIKEIVFYSLN
jgi:hypothetical protein